MCTYIVHQVLALTLYVAAAASVALAQDAKWKKYNENGWDAMNEGRYAEAERLFQSALQEAEQFSGQDTRRANTLSDLAWLYQLQGKNVEAQRLIKQSLAINENVLGLDHPNVASVLNTLATVYLNRRRF